MYLRAVSCLVLMILLLTAPQAWSQENANPFKPDHPRIILTKQRLDQLFEVIQTRNPWWGRLLDWAEIKTQKGVSPKDTPNLALIIALLNKDKAKYQELLHERIEMTKKGVLGSVNIPVSQDPIEASDLICQVALTLDWAYEVFSPGQRKKIADWLVVQASRFEKEPVNPLTTRNAAILRMLIMAGLAAEGESPGAKQLLSDAMQTRLSASLLACLDEAGKGGGWFEGDTAGARAGLYILEAAAALHTSQGLEAVKNSAWFQDRMYYLLFNQMPRPQPSGRMYYFPVSQDGDRILGQKKAADLVRLQLLLLRYMLPETKAAGLVQAQLLQGRRPVVLHPVHYAMEFILLDTQASQLPITSAPLAWHAENVGKVYMRSDWSEIGTWLKLSAGPHFAAAQHLDAGSLQLNRMQDLLTTGGVYDSPVSKHALNYASRSLAQSTLRIMDPKEYSWHQLRAGEKPKGAYANDGGQRAFEVYKANGGLEKSLPWAPGSWADFKKSREVYTPARITRFEMHKRYTYSAADITPAYKGSSQKASRVVRHVIHLLPGGPQDSEAAEVVAVLDDVSLNRESAKVRFVAHLPGKPELPAGLEKLGGGRFSGPQDKLRFLGADARLDIQAVYPSGSQLHLFGEPGNAASWVNGKNYPPLKKAPKVSAWRMELGQSNAKGKNRPMVTALLPADLNAPAPPKIDALASPQKDVAGMVIRDAKWPRVIVLKLGQPLARGELIYQYPSGNSRHLVLGVAPQTGFDIQVEAKRVVIKPGDALKSSKAGTLAFVIEPQKKVKDIK